jgi:arylsulfatase A-like enzyme
MGEDLDGRIGAVLDKIDELGIADNTYVIMCGDNGYRHSHYDEVSGLGQPLHSAKWWVWNGGLRVPMIVKGPDIEPNSVCTANVIQYDFLPTFVDWAGGNPETELPDVDGVSLAGLMRGETPTSEFLNRNLYFHCPHYRSEIPASAIISGTDKLMYFYGTSLFMPAGFNPKMLFDLSTDIGEYHNITPSNPTRAQELYDDLFQHLLVDTDAWMPLDPNPDYNPAVWYARLYEDGNPSNLDPNNLTYDYYWSPLPYVEGTVVGTRNSEPDE